MKTRKNLVTVDSADLIKMSNSLLEAMHNDGYMPECLVGIATGGTNVVKAMSIDHAVHVHSVRLQRPSTAAKEATPLMFVVRRLPYFSLNMVRRIEDRRRERLDMAKGGIRPVAEEELQAIADDVESSGIKRIAVIDDAVDSGWTLASVISALGDSLGPNVEIRGGVLTVTRPDTSLAILPDYRLANMTLMRFPWSMDYRA